MIGGVGGVNVGISDLFITLTLRATLYLPERATS